jgi:cbb3-type cytochrome oxidase subunit 3
MRKRIAYTLILMLLLLVFGGGYWSGFSDAQKGTRDLAGIDANDSQSTTTAKAEYQPYFTQRNHIPDKVR